MNMKKERTEADIKRAEYMRKWRATATPEQLDKQREANRRWIDEHRAEHINNMRKYYKENKSKIQEHARSARGKAAKRRKQAKERGAILATLTSAQWILILQAFGGCCAYCGMGGKYKDGKSSKVAIEQDHVIPLTRGGQHIMGNVVPCCRKCNLVKRRMTLSEWIFKLKDAERILRKFRSSEDMD